MTRIINSTVIFNGTNPTILYVNGGEQVKIQGVGIGTYTLKGRLSSDCAFDEVCAIKASDFSTAKEITDGSVYNADVAGYYQITVEAAGFEKIYVTIIG